jgi:hypothetical protein
VRWQVQVPVFAHRRPDAAQAECQRVAGHGGARAGARRQRGGRVGIGEARRESALDAYCAGLATPAQMRSRSASSVASSSSCGVRVRSRMANSSTVRRGEKSFRFTWNTCSTGEDAARGRQARERGV